MDGFERVVALLDYGDHVVERGVMLLGGRAAAEMKLPAGDHDEVFHLVVHDEQPRYRWVRSVPTGSDDW